MPEWRSNLERSFRVSHIRPPCDFTTLDLVEKRSCVSRPSSFAPDSLYIIEGGRSDPTHSVGTTSSPEAPCLCANASNPRTALHIRRSSEGYLQWGRDVGLNRLFSRAICLARSDPLSPSNLCDIDRGISPIGASYSFPTPLLRAPAGSPG